MSNYRCQEKPKPSITSEIAFQRAKGGLGNSPLKVDKCNIDGLNSQNNGEAQSLFMRSNTCLFKPFFLAKIAIILSFAFGCVSIQYKEHYNRFFMPYHVEDIAKTQPYNCLFVKRVLGDPSKIDIYLDPREHDPPFLIVHNKVNLEDNDLYNLTKEQPSFVPYQLCDEGQIHGDDQMRGVTTYNLNFLDTWAFDSNREKIRLVDTNFWRVLREEGDIDEIQTYLTIKDKPDSFLDIVRFVLTFSLGAKDTTKQIHLRFKPRIETLSPDRPQCKP